MLMKKEGIETLNYRLPASHIYNKVKIWGLETSLAIAMFTPIPAYGQYLEGDTRALGDIEYTDDPWVFNVSRPNTITRGLLNRHIALWASHGRYYDNDKGIWTWQRPNLFCTNEDLFTQTIVVPFLIPMLENAGATVFTPRERDWQPHEVIVDNDDAVKSPYYVEFNDNKPWKKSDSTGFARLKSMLSIGDNPFRMGTLRQAKATKRKHASEISYQPNLPEEGRYAVYVSYQTTKKSVPDAKYIVWHKGQKTVFTVNQRMGGGTWVYLGTFDFDRGCNIYNRVVVTNQASKRGVVTSDAVRFGGGMGNIERGGTVSGLPRCLEGARYAAQWSGAPEWVYNGRRGTNDYADDINTRSLMSNWLSGGSCYTPTTSGLRVPIELSMAVHSDAGFAPNGRDIVGSLAICTTDFNDGRLGSGVSRLTSKDFAKALLENLTQDVRARYRLWTKRYLWDRNYSETRLPAVPSAIIELLSHQNFPDMKLGQDPMFKFTVARSLYKTILRYVSSNHGRPYVVQPLPPTTFSVQLDHKGIARLKWMPQLDVTEPTARATSYNVYVATGTSGFDNGTNISQTDYELKLEPGVQYNFKITACNAGGESFPSETLSAYWTPKAAKTVLVVNGFHRLSSPQVIDDNAHQGFDIDADAGVSYGLTAGWNGHQQCFSRSQMGLEGPGGLGYGESEMAGHFIAGNDFNYPVDHCHAIAATGKYNVVSCSSEAVLTGRVKLTDFTLVDLVLGLERYDGYTPEYYKTFTPEMQRAISAYVHAGGALLASGSYIGSDMQGNNEKDFLASTLKTVYTPSDSAQLGSSLKGLGMEVDFYRTLNSKHYAAQHPDILAPGPQAICAMQYADGSPAAVAYSGNDYRCFIMGVPFECIKKATDKQRLMGGILQFLEHKR